jgi:hypothetical protein
MKHIGCYAGLIFVLRYETCAMHSLGFSGIWEEKFELVSLCSQVVVIGVT